MNDETTKALAPKQSQTPMQLLQIAVEGKADVEKLERLMDLQMKWESNEARKAFYVALNVVQTNLRPVTRDARNSQTNSKYARLESVHRELSPLLSENGFSVSHDETDCPKEGETRFRMRVRHVAGHEETAYIDLPLDNVGIKGSTNKTRVHGKASSATYAQRILETRFFSVVLAGEDDDGNAAATRVITEAQARQIDELLGKLDIHETDRTLEYCGVKALDEIPVQKYGTVIETLQSKIRARAK